MKLTLKIWRQKNPNEKGAFVLYPVDDVDPEMSILECLAVLNETLILRGEVPVAFEHDCREGICGSCGVMINGVAHGPQRATTACQLTMRHFKDGDELTLEPWRAKAFPPIKDLVVNRQAFDHIIEAGGYVSVSTGQAPDGNDILVGKEIADESMDAAACIGCGACVAACPNASAALFTGAKAILHGFLVADRFAVITKGRVEQARGGIDNPELVVSSRKFFDGVRREHFERLPVELFGLREVTKVLLERPTGLSCVKKPLVSNGAQLNLAARPAHAILFRKKIRASAIPPLRERKIPDSGQVLVSVTQVKSAVSRGLRVLNLLVKGERLKVAVHARCQPLFPLDFRKFVQRSLERADGVFLTRFPILRWLRENRGRTLAIPRGLLTQQPLRLIPLPRFPRQPDPVLRDQTPIRLFPWQSSLRRRIDEIGDDLLHQTRPLSSPCCVLVEHPQSLHGADHATPPAIGSSQAPCAQQIRFLSREDADHIAIPALVLAEVVVSQLPHRLDKRASRGDAPLRVVVLEKAPEEPWQRRMDPVVASAERGQQPYFGCSVEQCDTHLASKALHLRQAPLRLRIVHKSQRIHLHEPLKQVQQRQLFPLRFRKRVLESVRQRGRQRSRPSLARLVLEYRYARLELFYERFDLRSRLQPVAQRLPH